MPAYWRARDLTERLQHRLTARYFYVRQATRKARESSRIVASLVLSVSKHFLFAALVFTLSVVADHLLASAGPNLNLQFPLIGAKVTGLFAAIAANYANVHSMLVTVVQLTGIFLTLYFTAISLLASTVYSRVPGDVRALVVKEKVGNTYMRLVAMLGAMALMYIIGDVFGLRIGPIGVAVVSVLSVGSLFGFLVLGNRTFNFFQPAELVEYLVGDVAEWIRVATNPRKRFQTRSLQNYYRLNVDKLLTTYRNIVSLATKEEYYRIEPQALVRVLKFTSDLAVFYAQRKSGIPSKSFWFERVNRHKDWLTIGHTELEIALNTGRPVDPEQVPNFLWVEERLQTAFGIASTTLTSREDSHDWFEAANRLYYRLEELGGYFTIEEALLLFRAQRGEIEVLLRNVKLQPSAGLEPSNQRLSFCIGAVSFVAADLIAILIGFIKRLDTVGEPLIHEIAAALAADQIGAVYAKRLPRSVVTEAEWISNALRAETYAQQRLITPEWFVRQLIARVFVEFIKATCVTLVNELEQTFQPSLAILEAAQRHLFVAQLVSSGIEACEKFHVHLAAMQTLRRSTE